MLSYDRDILQLLTLIEVRFKTKKNGLLEIIFSMGTLANFLFLTFFKKNLKKTKFF